ncbi:helix-turn-helix domain-containing protein [Streptomyces viridiviolaceus]|uniref:Helix-turn-helix domain-containing protein n=1 Tax=Streptomyces viridiviolaceus TaxID=68282 RepID=A0ABW2DZV7_9ACTN|nr:helix-turn-helix domain-containing protein [Streptomyces viridiviolaceus]
MRALRLARCWTIEELAEASGVSVRAIGDMERGRSLRPQRGTVTALVQGLDLDEAAHSELLAALRAGRPATKPSVSPASPYALPRGVRDFVGRHAELATLRTLVQQSVTESRTGNRAVRSPAPVVVLFGPPGSGKTTLAIRLAEESAPSFPDGAFLIDMRGLDAQPLSADQAVLRLLDAWGVADAELGRQSAEERLARYHATAAALRAVVVLDNVGSEAQVRPLLPREGGLLLVVSSRRTLAGLEGVHRTELGALTREDSASLLRAVVGADRVDAEPAAVLAVTELCGHLPLALRVAANWAATRTNWSLQRLADRLTDEERRLDALSAGDLRVNTAFALSYSRLAPGTARMFRLLSLVPGADFSIPSAAVLADTSLPAAEDLLEELLDAGLLMASPGDRYRFHDLLRLYAGARHRAEDGDEASVAAKARLRAWLLDTAVLAGRWYEPEHGAPSPAPGRLVALGDREQAMRWMKTESDNWLAAFREAVETGEHAKVIEVADATIWFSDHWVSWGHWIEVYKRAAEAAAALGDPVREATHRNNLAGAYWIGERRHDKAVGEAGRALAIAEKCGDVTQQAWAHHHLGGLHALVDDLPPAADHYQRAKELFAQADEVNGYLAASNMTIRVAEKAGRPRQAVAAYDEVMDLLGASEYRDRIPPNVRDYSTMYAAFYVSFAHLNQGHWQDAVDALRPIRGQLEAHGWHERAGMVHLHMAHALVHLGELAEAETEYRAVLTMADLVPPAMLDEARAALDALAAGTPSPPTHFA